MAVHPLIRLRNSTGLSQRSYAQLIARTHAELGHGQMAARREKISRWESGRIAPDFSTQLAIARIHQVDEEVVLRLGWPNWLCAASGDQEFLRQPWTPEGSIAICRLTTITPGHTRTGLISTGPSLTTQIRGAIASLSGNSRPLEREGCPITPGTLAWTESRIRALEALEAGSPVSQYALHVSARTEHQLISDLLNGYGYDRATGARLLRLAARTASLCTWTSYVLGEEAQTERYNLAAVRAASAAGAPHHTAAYLMQLCFRHLHLGHPRDVLSLLGAAREVASRPTARMTVLRHTHEALALARLSDPTASLRALQRAEHALGATAPQWDAEADPTGSSINEDYLAFSTAHTWLLLGKPARALSVFTGLPDDDASPYAAIDRCLVVEAQLAAGQLEESAATVRGVVERTGCLPPGLAERFQDLLAPHADQPHVRDALDCLTERSAAQRTIG
ncbi:helix-turn-helix transcriptional regulator [Streptomyces sp. NPDC048606]|uniref:helix-turn-helix transcriptional regulator n=1 Tax=Streptomyces sp. NPDC048606 TaxID=3154726 RepID=UPI0034128AD2